MDSVNFKPHNAGILFLSDKDRVMFKLGSDMMVHKLGLLLLVFSSGLFASNLVGEIVPPYPGGMTSKTGACISKALGLMRVCDYSVGVLEDATGKLLLLYLGKKIDRNSAGETTWKVLDQLSHPKVEQSQTLIIAACQHVSADEIDESIIAVAEITDQEWLTNITWAYKADYEKEKFSKLSAKGIKCINDAIGME